MSTSWRRRKNRLNVLLDAGEDEDAQGLALDRILHGQHVIGTTSKTKQIDDLKFGDKDLDVVGTLEYGQYGVIDVVTCKLGGRAYVRKSIEKRFAVKNQDQCSPQIERDILLRALKSRTPWAPHLLCAYQSPTHLNLMMDYAEGGTLWDVLESSPHDGRILESDVLWWASQAASAILWCHTQNFVHRDIKPHNFVITADSRLLLIDFGSAAPLLTPAFDGSQLVPKRYCLVPCGTCDYISPEILQSHEEALVALEMSDEPELSPSYSDYEPGGYGRETDWWSFGAMLYEMVYGVAPFFSNDIRQTYLKIMDYPHSLHFNRREDVSASLQDLLRRLLATSELRLGRQSADDVTSHPFFDGIDWQTLHQKQRPDGLHLPEFNYTAPIEPQGVTTGSSEESNSRLFSFSALFQSSTMSEPTRSPLQPTPTASAGRSILREVSIASFIGFSWGPPTDAFPASEKAAQSPLPENVVGTPQPLKYSTRMQTLPTSALEVTATPQHTGLSFVTPVRPSMTPFKGVQSTARRTSQKRPVSDRGAMKQLVDCVGMSARKRVLESGRKPRLLANVPGTGSSKTSTLKALRFDRSVMVVGGDSGVSYRMEASSTSASGSVAASSGAGGSMSGGLWGPLAHDEDEFDVEESSGVAELSYSPTPMARPRAGSTLSLMGRSRASSSSSVASLLSRAGSGKLDGSTGAQVGTHNDARIVKSSVFPAVPGMAMAMERQEDRTREVDVFDVRDVDKENLSYDALDALEKRHRRLMQEIYGIGSRLSAITTGTRVGQGSKPT